MLLPIIRFEYNKIKTKLPTITYNSTFDGHWSDSNYILSTGLLDIDIGGPEFDINQLDKSKIFIYYKSFSGLGYSILVESITLH